RPIFDEVFRGFFDPGAATPIDLFDRLRAEGFTDDEIETLQEALAAATEGGLLAALLGVGGGGELTRLLRRADVQRSLAGLASPPFTSLTDAEVDEVRRAVRRLAEKLRGKARVRRKHARRGAIDVRRTMRLSWRTGAVPIAPVRKRRRRDRPKLVVLCDVSD